MKYFFTTLFFLPFLLFSQQKEDTLFEFSAGKKYLLHTAVAGNTLWGLHSTYKASVDDIVAANKGIEKGVKEGILYRIPFGKSPISVKDGSKFVQHFVVKSETQYTLCKKYGIKAEELLKINPSISGSLKIGDKIYLPMIEDVETVTPPVVVGTVKPPTETIPPVVSPAPKISFTDTIVEYVVKSKETMYTISKRFMVPVSEIQAFNKLKTSKVKVGDVLKIPLKKENIKPVVIRPVIPLEPLEVDEELLLKPVDKIKIAVLLPLDLSSKGTNAMKSLAAEYCMGVQEAVKVMENDGLNVTLEIIDFPTDSIAIKTYLKRPEMKTFQLIYGPLIPQDIEYVSVWCKENKITLVSPSSVNPNLVKSNTMLQSAVTSDVFQYKALAKYALEKNKVVNVILINTGSAKDKEMYDAFRSGFLEISKEFGSPKLIEAKTSDYINFVKKNTKNILVYLTKDKALAMKFMNAASKAESKSGKGNLQIFGTKDWANFNDIAGNYKTAYRLTWVSSSDLNYKSENAINLNKLVRANYKIDLSKVIAQAYDVTLYFTYKSLNKPVPNLISNTFSMKTNVNGGSENTSAFIFVHSDFELIQDGFYHE